jgi:hypothetical protein
MDAQTVINTLLMLAGFLGGWILNNITKDINKLNTDVDAITTKVQAVELLVAGTYVKRDDMNKLGDAIFAQLNKMDANQTRQLERIEAKLDGKQDKVRA